MMKENERLVLLKEVAGTRVYDERRAEAFKNLEETGLSIPLHGSTSKKAPQGVAAKKLKKCSRTSKNV